jgi:hypothetical protein
MKENIVLNQLFLRRISTMPRKMRFEIKAAIAFAGPVGVWKNGGPFTGKAGRQYHQQQPLHFSKASPICTRGRMPEGAAPPGGPRWTSFMLKARI